MKDTASHALGRAPSTLDARGHRVPMSRAALGARRLARVFVGADLVFFAEAIYALVRSHGDFYVVMVAIPFLAVLALADLGVWDLERPALKVRLLFAGLSLLLAAATPLVRARDFSDFQRDLNVGIGYWIGFMALAVAWIVVCLIALRVPRPGHRRRAAAPAS